MFKNIATLEILICICVYVGHRAQFSEGINVWEQEMTYFHLDSRSKFKFVKAKTGCLATGMSTRCLAPQDQISGCLPKSVVTRCFEN